MTLLYKNQDTYKVLFFLLVLFVGISCEKEMTPQADTIFSEKKNEQSNKPNAARFTTIDHESENLPFDIQNATLENNEIPTDCNNLPSDVNFMYVIVRKVNWETEWFCFVESEITEVLTDLGWSPNEIQATYEILFDPSKIYGVFSYQIASHLYASLNLDPSIYTSCFFGSTRLGEGPYPYSLPNGSGPAPPTCDFGTMNILYTGNSFNNTQNGCFVFVAGSNMIRLRLNEGSTTDVINLPLSVPIIESALLNGGWSLPEIEIFFEKFVNGYMTPRRFYNIVQYDIIPNHPDYLALPLEEIIQRYFYSVNLSLFDFSTLNHGTFTLFGNADLYCGFYDDIKN